ncbi:hypothetical protein Tco_0152897 [Tanacetum coccineum]
MWCCSVDVGGWRSSLGLLCLAYCGVLWVDSRIGVSVGGRWLWRLLLLWCGGVVVWVWLCVLEGGGAVVLLGDVGMGVLVGGVGDACLWFRGIALVGVDEEEFWFELGGVAVEWCGCVGVWSGGVVRDCCVEWCWVVYEFVVWCLRGDDCAMGWVVCGVFVVWFVGGWRCVCGRACGEGCVVVGVIVSCGDDVLGLVGGVVGLGVGVLWGGECSEGG